MPALPPMSPVSHFTQAELDLAAPSPAQCAERLPVLEALLRQCRRATRAQIAFRLGWSERMVRAVAAESRIILRAPGRHGYTLLDDASAEEIYAAANRIRSQMGEMELTLAHYTQVAGLKVALGKKTEAASATEEVR
jgi:hypothetical protein